jgi:hypothetical protein
MTKIVESSLGAFGPVRVDQLESDTTNNESNGGLNWSPRMSKGWRLAGTPARPLT